MKPLQSKPLNDEEATQLFRAVWEATAAVCPDDMYLPEVALALIEVAYLMMSSAWDQVATAKGAETANVVGQDIVLTAVARLSSLSDYWQKRTQAIALATMEPAGSA